jgi:hypothetical protein
MARPRKQPPVSLTKDELIYLAGLFDGTIGLRGTSDIYAVAISKKPDWPEVMAKKYGGESKPFTSKGGKVLFGWFVPLQRRLELFLMLENAQLIQSLDPYDRDGVRGRLQKSINSLKERGGD